MPPKSTIRKVVVISIDTPDDETDAFTENAVWEALKTMGDKYDIIDVDVDCEIDPE